MLESGADFEEAASARIILIACAFMQSVEEPCVRTPTEGTMPEGKPEHPAVKVASVVGGIILVIVLMIAILAKEYLPMVGWVVIPLAIMGIVLGVIASHHRG